MNRFQLLLSCLPLAGLFCAAPARAQWSAYAAATLTDYGYSVSSSGIGYKGLSGGITGGGFYNFPIQSRVTVGADFRGEYSPGSKGGEFFSADLRIAFVPTHNPLRPFLGIGGGVASTPHAANVYYGSTAQRTTGGGLQLDFGLDIRLTQRLDYRVLDYGGIGGVNVGTGFVSTGLVYHFAPARP